MEVKPYRECLTADLIEIALNSPPVSQAETVDLARELARRLLRLYIQAAVPRRTIYE